MVRSISRYAEQEITSTDNREERQALIQDYGRLYSNSNSDVRQRHPARAMRAYAPKLAKKVLTKRYDDLFEELMKYMKEDDIMSREDYKAALKDVMNPRLEEGTLTTRNVNNLYEELISTPRAKAFFRDRNVQKIETEKQGERFVREGRKKRYAQYIEEGRELYRVVNPTTKSITIVYSQYVTQKDKRKKVWRDVNTGRFGQNPTKIKQEYE